ncbi:hypothetical protein KP509_36G024600 [Ceratopteris richardii]|uniref:UspA domain-containing protein n=1 Tax=Ceratopteris richardii TaxID=49495 RepID=A0A8T2QB08_CERRI|nr:hypothetical protein KP509_36G024600 [Ceratopteris richardii]
MFCCDRPEPRRIVVVVDDGESARMALGWAMLNVIRSRDIITLLHVHPSSAAGSEGSRRYRRLKGFQLALSFKDLCDMNPHVKVEIVVAEGDEGPTIVSYTKKLGASALIMGHHKHPVFRRCLGKKDTLDYCIKNSNCLVLAVKQHRKVGFNAQGKTVSEVRILKYF